jgi:uncharacterized protein (DUF2267 family)
MMHYQEFLIRVQQFGNLTNRDDVQRVVEASIATLGERMSLTAIHKLGSQFPKELKNVLSEHKAQTHFNLEEFYKRVSARAAIGYPEAVRLSRVVMSVLNEMVTTELLQHILEDFPPEYAELFGQSPTTPLSPTV